MKTKFFFILLFAAFSLNTIQAKCKDKMIIAGKAIVERHSYKTIPEMNSDSAIVSLDVQDSIYYEPAHKVSIVLLASNGTTLEIGQTDSLGNFRIEIDKSQRKKYNEIHFSLSEKSGAKRPRTPLTIRVNAYSYSMPIPTKSKDFYNIILKKEEKALPIND